MRKLVTLGKYLLFASIPALLVLLGIEAVLYRVSLGFDFDAFSRMPLGRPGECYRPSLRVGYEPVPGRCSHDALGFLMGQHTVKRAPGTFRILVLGDSISEQRVWVDRLEEQLNEALPGRKIEVWNAGVSGYDTCSELGVLEEKGLGIDPDLVLVQACYNDFVLTATVFPLGNGRIRYFAGNTYVDFPAWMIHSRLLTWLVVRFGGHRAAERNRNLDGEIQSARCFKAMKGIADRRGIPLVSVIFPALELTSALEMQPPHQNPLRLEKKLEEIHGALKIDAIVLRAPFEKVVSLEQLRSSPADTIHPSPWGHDLAAHFVRNHLLERYFGWKGDPGAPPTSDSGRPLKGMGPRRPPVGPPRAP